MSKNTVFALTKCKVKFKKQKFHVKHLENKKIICIFVASKPGILLLIVFFISAYISDERRVLPAAFLNEDCFFSMQMLLYLIFDVFI